MPEADSRRAAPGWWLAVVIGALVPAGIASVYLAKEAPAVPVSAPAQETPHAVEQSAMAAMVERLEARLAAAPQDADGWNLLAKSYDYLGRKADAERARARAAALTGAAPAPAARPVAEPLAVLEQRTVADPGDASGWAALAAAYHAADRELDAARAYAKAIAIEGDHAQWLADYADTLAVANGRRLAGEPEQLLARALAADPDHPKALWLAATAALQRADHAAAVKYWEHLYAVLPPESPDRPIIAANLEESRRAAAAR